MPEYSTQPLVLFAPLNWGMGHATRMMPVIHQAHAVGYRVVILTSSPLLGFFAQTCPFAKLVDDGCAPVYWSASSMGLIRYFEVALKMLRQIFHEHKVLRCLHAEHNFGLIISDNRYGICLKQVKSVFVTHQFAVKLPAFLHIFEPLVNRCLRLLYRRFDEIWIPDSLEQNLAGGLSWPARDWSTARFIGPLSRYSLVEETACSVSLDVLVLLSGPEPARSHWRGKLERFFDDSDYVVGFAQSTEDGKRGLASKRSFYYLYNGSSNEIKGLLKHTPQIIARCGYSTLMDLAVMGKNALLVPTPGQSEQLYLAQWLADHPLFMFVEEDQLTLDALKMSQSQQGLITREVSLYDNWKSFLKRECEKHSSKT